VKLTVACLWVAGHVAYSADYVERLHSMVARHLTRPFRFVCLTDRPQWRVPYCAEVIGVPRVRRGVFAWWHKLYLFSRAYQSELTERVLYLDLDSLIVAPLDPIIDFPAPFAIVPDGGSAFRPRDGRLVVKRFNSSVMIFDRGVHAELAEAPLRETADRLWGDQDLIGEMCPGAATMPLEWFPRLSRIQDGAVPAEAKIVLCKKPKNVEAAEIMPWFAERWR